jgi:hypothetical protein
MFKEALDSGWGSGMFKEALDSGWGSVISDVSGSVYLFLK